MRRGLLAGKKTSTDFVQVTVGQRAMQIRLSF